MIFTHFPPPSPLTGIVVRTSQFQRHSDRQMIINSFLLDSSSSLSCRFSFLCSKQHNAPNKAFEDSNRLAQERSHQSDSMSSQQTSSLHFPSLVRSL
jgi:hypothetical protein